MATFAYNAINAEGLEFDGVLSAADLASALDQLRLRGLLADRLEQVDDGHEKGSTVGAFKGVKPKSLQIFSRQFATMIEAGMNVVGSLVILEQQTDDAVLESVISALREDVEAGLLLSEAMARHPKVFNRLYVAMVEAGEAAGVLDIVLDRVALQIEKSEQIKRRVKSAMIYPTIVLIFATLVLIGMLLFLVPIFTKIFASLHGQLPSLTKDVVAASNVLRNDWFILFPLWGGSIFGFFRWKKSDRGRPVWDRMRLHFPMKIGLTIRKITMARFSRTLSTLVAAGVDIIKALEITGQTSGNWVVENALDNVRTRVREGATIAQPLIDDPVFPPMVSQMVRIGEETGELEKMLGKIADFYEDEVDASIASLTSIVEPVMMIGVGIMVGIILIAMYLPMFKMLSLVH
ncbi:MAG: type II secretion system F family protein [Actinobacteria bacterium]|nr:type II secretion system F family protein [Actinomycetota bacterium]MBV8394638.1 type II secretion system F family protein [Actinomycetota bacterium]MBV8599193.1 type II secretion system F family protein [Actinomycetota bacterium]